MADVLRGLAFGLQELGRQTQGAKTRSIEEEDRRLDEEDRKRRRDREDRDLARRDRLDALDEREFNRSMELLGLQLEAAKDAREQVKLAGSPEERAERTQELERLELDIQLQTLEASKAQTALTHARAQSFEGEVDTKARDRRIAERKQRIADAEKTVEIVKNEQNDAREKLSELIVNGKGETPEGDRLLEIINRTEDQLDTAFSELQIADGIVLPEMPTLDDLPIELTDQGQGEPEPGGGILGKIGARLLPQGFNALRSAFTQPPNTRLRSFTDVGPGARKEVPSAGLGDSILDPRELLPEIPDITSSSTINPFRLRRQ